jgi:TATA-box binding protein (TBP) (component of TFIID and TFIIIB)
MLYNNKYDKPNYKTVSGIRIYTGTTKYSKHLLKQSIKYHKSQIKQKIFTELTPSTLTAKGQFSNISFDEEDIIDMLTVPEGGYILKIGCNYGVLTNPCPNYEQPAVKARVSNRGRKPKIKPKSKRKLQGSGKFFSSQITFEIYNPDNYKVYKIKLFRNGGFQVPGVKKPDMTDLINPINTLLDYLRVEFMNPKIKVIYFISVMRNYICRIIDTNVLIRLNDLEIMLKNQKDNFETNQYIYDYVATLNTPCEKSIQDYIGIKKNLIGIAEIQNNCERYFGLILKFYRPVPWKENKRTTIKILRSGKINFDGGNSEDELIELYHWLENVFENNKDQILYNSQSTIDASVSDSDSNDSIYDDMLSDLTILDTSSLTSPANNNVESSADSPNDEPSSNNNSDANANVDADSDADDPPALGDNLVIEF